MIQIKSLIKRFGDFVAVDGLQLEVKPGDIVGFLGPNGAGKSTTMKMITGFLPPSSGEILIDGESLAKAPINIKKKIGYLPEGAPAYADMTVLQFLHFIAQVRGFKGKEKNQRIKDVVEKVELQQVLNRPIENLSKGFKRRVGLAQAIIHDPLILILDEPTDGLDPNQKHQVRKLIQNLSKDKIVIISTHILEEVTAVCNRAVIIANGKKVFDGTPKELQQSSQFHNAVTIEFEGDKPDISQLKLAPGVTEIIERDSHTVSVIGHESYESLFPQIMDLVHLQGWHIKAMYNEVGQLDDVFRSLTKEEAA
ncbi:ABC transporter [Catenovulum agarivorans DS-2]|uniref:ABC transporter n=1 Tax=Catenovulum agarivorans DS-2 TaxID=1328313 RepID=W7QWJ7_9ALTE|nr:ATP-binding cassette domain-containing protein [Catenovulum agarivorans]EWH09635.1 ABC transporter [Catenovulum agarivorans DS-2]